MSTSHLTGLQRELLEYLADHDGLTVSPDNALDVAGSFATTAQELAAAKNALVALGYATEDDPVFAGGNSVIHITDAGRQALQPAVSKRPWWKIW